MTKSIEGGAVATGKVCRMLPKAIVAIAMLTTGAQAAEQTPSLVAGAGKVDITPSPKSLKPGDRIVDRLFARAIVLGSGSQCAVLVGVDQVGLPDPLVRSALARTSTLTGCPVEHIVISATHTHSGSTTGIARGGEPSPQRIEDAIVVAATAARAAMRPARLGYATTDVHLNVNRDLFDRDRWVQGPDVQGKSDKTLAVISLLDDGGWPIGIYMNYAMHPVNFYLSGVISADFPGAASRYVEQSYGPDMVAIFAQGASGDQNPRLQRPQRQLIRVRTRDTRPQDMALTAAPPWVIAAGRRNSTRRAAEQMSIPVTPADRPAYETAIASVSQMVDALGVIIGESALQAIVDQRGLTRTVDIRGATETVTCPGRDRMDRADPVRQGELPLYADGLPVSMRVGALRLGDVYVATVNGEVYSDIAVRLKSEAPVSRLMMTTLANGMAESGYIYSNEAAPRLTFQVIGSRLKPGCAEDAIVDAGLRLIARVREK